MDVDIAAAQISSIQQFVLLRVFSRQDKVAVAGDEPDEFLCSKPIFVSNILCAVSTP